MQNTNWPMQGPGGAFLGAIGGGIVVGGVMLARANTFQSFVVPLLVGAAAGAVLLVAARLWAAGRIGRPTRWQVLAMLSAIVFEVAVFWAVGAMGWFNLWDERTVFGIALAIVAVHFLPMRISHGPLILWLGVAALAWIAVADGLRLPVPILLVGDGLLKVVFGALMTGPLFARTKPA